MAAPANPTPPPGGEKHTVSAGGGLPKPPILGFVAQLLGLGAAAAPAQPALSLQDHEVEVIKMEQADIDKLGKELEAYRFGLDADMDKQVRGLQQQFQKAKAGLFFPADLPRLVGVEQRWESLKSAIGKAEGSFKGLLESDPSLLNVMERTAAATLGEVASVNRDLVDVLFVGEWKSIEKEAKLSPNASIDQRLAVFLKYRDFINRLQPYLPKMRQGQIDQLGKNLKAYQFGLGPHLDKKVRNLQERFSRARSQDQFVQIAKDWDRMESEIAQFEAKWAEQNTPHVQEKDGKLIFEMMQRQIHDVLMDKTIPNWDAFQEEYSRIIHQENHLPATASVGDRLSVLRQYRDLLDRINAATPRK